MTELTLARRQEATCDDSSVIFTQATLSHVIAELKAANEPGLPYPTSQQF